MHPCRAATAVRGYAPRWPTPRGGPPRIWSPATAPPSRRIACGSVTARSYRPVRAGSPSPSCWMRTRAGSAAGRWPAGHDARRRAWSTTPIGGPVHGGVLRAGSRPAQPRLLDEPVRHVPRQRQGGKLLRHPQGRARRHAGLADARRDKDGDLRMGRGLLPSAACPLSARLPRPRHLRRGPVVVALSCRQAVICPRT